MKVSFSLASSKAKASKPVGDAPSLKRPVAFASLEDDEPVGAVGTASGSNSSKTPANKQLIAQTVGMSKAMKRQIEEEKKVDATVFEYDEVWDKMQEAKARQKVVKEVDTTERKVRPRILHPRYPYAHTPCVSPSTSVAYYRLQLPDGLTISGRRRK